MTPEPVAWWTRCAVTGNRRNVKFASLVAVDERQSPPGWLSQRSKQSSSGGAMAVFSSSLGLPRELPLMWSPRAMSQTKVGPSFSAPAADDEYDQILQLRAVGAHA